MGSKCYNTIFINASILFSYAVFTDFITDFAYKLYTEFKYINFCNMFSI